RACHRSMMRPRLQSQESCWSLPPPLLRKEMARLRGRFRRRQWSHGPLGRRVELRQQFLPPLHLRRKGIAVCLDCVAKDARQFGAVFVWVKITIEMNERRI